MNSIIGPRSGTDHRAWLKLGLGLGLGVGVGFQYRLGFRPTVSVRVSSQGLK